MTAAPIFDVKNRLPYFIHLVESGETVQITRHGKPVARLVSEKEIVQQQKTEGDLFMEKVMEWRERNKDWLGDADIQEAFNIPRTIEPNFRHPEEYKWEDE